MDAADKIKDKGLARKLTSGSRWGNCTVKCAGLVIIAAGSFYGYQSYNERSIV